MPNKILHIFDEYQPDVSWTSHDRQVFQDTLGGKHDEEVPWGKLLDRYGAGKGVYIGFDGDGKPRSDNSPPWREISFGSRNPVVENKDGVSDIQVNAYRLDSYTIQAQRRGIVPASDEDIIENAIQGLLVKDGHVTLAVRTRHPADVFNVLPGGSVSWKEHYTHNPLEDAMYAETLEEAGTDIINPRLLGIFNQTGLHTNRQWVYVAEPVKDHATIMDEHVKGFALYEDVKAETGDEIAARTALEDSPYATDAWEARCFAKIPYTTDAILELLDKGSYHYSDEEEPAELITSLWAALYVSGAVDFGEDFTEDAKRIIGDNVTF